MNRDGPGRYHPVETCPELFLSDKGEPRTSSKLTLKLARFDVFYVYSATSRRPRLAKFCDTPLREISPLKTANRN